MGCRCVVASERSWQLLRHQLARHGVVGQRPNESLHLLPPVVVVIIIIAVIVIGVVIVARARVGPNYGKISRYTS